MLGKKDRYNSQKGFAVITVLIMLLIFSVMATSLLSIWGIDARRLKQEEETMQSYYTAYSITNAYWSYIEKEQSVSTRQLFQSIANNITWSSDDKIFGVDELSHYKVTIERTPDAENPSDSLIIITTRGMAGKCHSDIKLTITEKRDTDEIGNEIYYYVNPKWEN